MSHDPIQGHGQGHGGLIVVKMVDFKVYRLVQHARNQNINVELRFSETMSKF